MKQNIEKQKPTVLRRMGPYEKYIKRPLDFVLSLMAVVFLAPVLIVLATMVRFKLGAPVIFKQKRPGLNEDIFIIYKFRTMTDKKDEGGALLPDELRMTKFGKILRKTSLDELPELFNILKGEMSLCGPRPQLVRDMVFMSKEQRMRHSVRPGLSGLAQVNGRNAIKWEEKLDYDLKYIKKITFFVDVKIIFQTIMKAFVKQDDISEDGMATAEDLGDYLLRESKIGVEEYNESHAIAEKILKKKF